MDASSDERGVKSKKERQQEKQVWGCGSRVELKWLSGI